MKRVTTMAAVQVCVCCSLAGTAIAQVQDTTTRYQYDAAGNVVQITDPLNHITRQEFDVLGRRTKVTDARSGATQYVYDGLDQLVQVSDARNLTTSYTIDGLGRLSQTSSPDTGATFNVYDEAGNIKTRTDAKGQTTSYQYDVLNRVTQASYSDGTSATYVYDVGANAIGRLSQVSDVSGTTQYSYEPHGRLSQETRTIGGQSYSTAYRYDAGGRLAGIDYPTGRSVDYVRNEAGRIQEIRTSKGGVTQLLVSQASYQPFGPLQSLVFGNGQRYARTYDLNGRMMSYTLNGQVQTVSYDAASRLTGVSDAAGGASRSYGYDELDRLTSEQRAQSSLGYTYDAVGNRTQMVNGAAVTGYSYGTASNRLAQVTGGQGGTPTMDANGSTTGNGSSAFNYDARGRMVSANAAIGLVSYRINALGQRVQKLAAGASTVFHYDSGGRLIAESTGDVVTDYVYLDDIPVAVLR
jgi:YD repeat-containing protein